MNEARSRNSVTILREESLLIIDVADLPTCEEKEEGMQKAG